MNKKRKLIIATVAYQLKVGEKKKESKKKKEPQNLENIGIQSISVEKNKGFFEVYKP